MTGWCDGADKVMADYFIRAAHPHEVFYSFISQQFASDYTSVMLFNCSYLHLM